MSNPKSEIHNNKPIHFSVGAIIVKDDKYLLIDRVQPPLGFAGVAGHIDEGEDAERAIRREVEEESGLKIKNLELLFEEYLDWNWCSKKINGHHWYLFRCEFDGDLKLNKEETKSIGWYSVEEIKKMILEPVWEYWFKKLKIIS